MREALAGFGSRNPAIEVVVQARADVAKGGEMVYVEGLIPGILVELAAPLE